MDVEIVFCSWSTLVYNQISLHYCYGAEITLCCVGDVTLGRQCWKAWPSALPLRISCHRSPSPSRSPSISALKFGWALALPRGRDAAGWGSAVICLL